MNPQLDLLLPIPIMEEIISLSASSSKVTFRATCKRFELFITDHFFSTFTTTLCGNISEYKNGELTHTQFKYPTFGALDSSSNSLYVSDHGNHVIRKIDLFTHQVTTLCGDSTNHTWKDGVGSEARFRYPEGMALDEKKRILYVSDSYNHVIRSVNLIDGSVTTIVGNPRKSGNEDGIGEDAVFLYPSGLALDSISNCLYVTDRCNHSIRKIVLGERRVETLCGGKRRGYKNGSFEETMVSEPTDIALNPNTQELYVSDRGNDAIRVLSLQNRTVDTLCGFPGFQEYEDGTFTQAKFDRPKGLALDSRSKCLYVSDGNHIIRKISLFEKGNVTTFCGTPRKGGNKSGFFPTFENPEGIVIDPQSQTLYVIDCRNHKVKKIIDKKSQIKNV